ncbi:MAG: choice-of-anchor Q domain-containing protein, partial [Kiritimatiellia bacterium]
PRATIYNTIFSSTSGSTVTAALLKNTIRTEATALDTTTYRPAATSPALNAGTTSSPYIATENDFSGNQRLNGTIDIGAVEWWLPKPQTPTVEIDENTYSATITWPEVLDANQYQIAGETIAQTTICIGNLVPGITYTSILRAVATNVSNCQNWSESDPFTYTIPVRLDLSPRNPTAVFPAGTLDFNVASNWIWTVESDSNWATPLPNDHGFTLQYTRNEASAPRTATLTLRSSTKILTTTFTQTGYNQLPPPVAGFADNPFKNQVTIPLSQPDNATDLPVEGTLVYTLDGTDPTLENAVGKVSGRRLALEATLTNDAHLKARIISSSAAYADSAILATNFFRAWLLSVDGAERGWHTKGDSILLEAPTRTGYRFANWSGTIESSDNPLSFTMPAGNVSLSTAYTLLPPTLVSPANGAAVKGQVRLSIAHSLPVETVRWFLNGSQVAETASTSLDATAWVADGENSWHAQVLIDGQWVDSALARFTFLRTWPVVVDGATNSWHTKNETVQFSAPTRTGYRFANWSGTIESSDNPLSFTMPAGNVSLSTAYTLLPPTLVSPANGAAVKGQVRLSIAHSLPVETVRWFLNGSQVAETASTSLDATAWVADGENSWHAQVLIDGQWVDSALARFTFLRTWPVVVDGATNSWHTKNETVQFSAPTRTGYRFANWSGTIESSDNPLSFAMPAAEVILNTTYSLLPPTLSAPADGAETKGRVTLAITHPLAISSVRWYINDTPVAETSSTTFDATVHLQYGQNSWRVEAQIDEQWVESETASFTHLQPDAVLVSPTGDNSDGLTWQTAFNTIQAAVDAAPSGGTVLVTNGTYSTGAVRATSSTTRLLITKSITIQSVEGAAKTILQGAGKEAYNTTNSLQTLTIEGANLSVHILGITFSGGANLFNEGGGAIAINAQDSTIHIARCAIESSEADFGSALYAGGSRLALTLSSCLICANSGDYTLCSEAIDSQTRLVNCTIVQNTPTTTPVYGFTVRNTLLAANSANTLNNATDEGNNHFAATTSLFTDPSGHDYTLRNTATDCIDKGHTAAAVDTLDLAGTGRVQGVAVDIGAYEYPAGKTHTAKGTPYSWILAYYPDAAGDLETLDLEDRDGDGFPTYEEYIAGTDPTDPDSFLRATIRFDGNTCIIEPAHELPPDRIVEILGAPTLSAPFTAPTNAASRFFKIQLSLPD